MSPAKKKRAVSVEGLTRSAYRYLEKFSSTEAQVFKVLCRRIDRVMTREADPEALAEARAVAAEVAQKCRELGLVNDRLYASARARRLLARGKPVRTIQADLRHKGVGEADREAALMDLREETGGADPDVQAAMTYARKRRFGPYRTARISRETDEALKHRRHKEYAAMARAGFSYDLCRQALEISEYIEDEPFSDHHFDD